MVFYLTYRACGRRHTDEFIGETALTDIAKFIMEFSSGERMDDIAIIRV